MASEFVYIRVAFNIDKEIKQQRTGFELRVSVEAKDGYCKLKL